MKNTAHILFVCSLAGVLLSGCSTVSVPNVDFLKLPEFREIVKNNQTNVPDVNEIPAEPDNVRADVIWDADAKELAALRERFAIPRTEGALASQAQIDAEFERLKSKAQAYQLDDP